MRDWLTYRATATPDHPALVRARDGTEWDYAALDRQVSDLAGRLSALGLRPGDHLGVVLAPGVSYVPLVHAAMRLGLILVPLGHDLTEPELASRAEMAAVTAIICDSQTRTRADKALDETDVPILNLDRDTEDTPSATDSDTDDGKTFSAFEDLAVETDTGTSEEQPPSVTTTEIDDTKSIKDVESADFEPFEWSRDDRLLILFTSGTTGTPKPVDIRMGNLLSNAIASGFRLGTRPDDRWLVTLSFHHTGGIAPLYRAVLYGTTIVLRESFEPGPAADDIDRYDVTGVSLVPTMLQQMLDARGTLSDSLRIVLLGGAPASEELIERCQGFSIPVYPTYGMTETASQVATAYPEEAFSNRGTVGRPLFWTDVTIVDESGDPVATGERGEIVVSGPMVVPGYYKQEEKTAAAFSDRGFHTGDVGRFDENGHLYVTNRLDDRIITGGENVDPGEVAAVLEDYPAVAEAAVVGVPDDTWGEIVGALVVPTEPGDVVEEPEATVLREELENRCEERLAPFKRPRIVEFVDELPRTISGTVNRDDVQQLLEAHETNADEVPDEETQSSDQSPVDEGQPKSEKTTAEITTEDSETTEGENENADASEEGEADDSEFEYSDPKNDDYGYAEPPDVEFRNPEESNESH